VPEATPAPAIDEVPVDDLVGWLGDMIMIRRFEEVADDLSLRGKIAGGIHPAIGQEAVAVGTVRALQPADIVTGTHRSHHHALAKGLPPGPVLAELYGKATGVVDGRGGSMHLADFTRGLWGSNGIVGAGLGIALGASLGAAVRHSGQVIVGFFGDGGVNTGRVWEFVNLAAVWRLPLIAVCENNLYAVETPSQTVTGGGSAAARARGFGLPAEEVDGQDVLAVHRAVSAAAARARSGDGPSFLEMRTYRYRGHNTGEIIRYRTEEEVADWRSSRDPIDRLAAHLEAAGVLTPDELAALAKAQFAEIDAAVRFADEFPWPDPGTARLHVTGLADAAQGGGR
jgi:TPP-dependent pyruvate/acetoin dehydrogenase alpha subunit